MAREKAMVYYKKLGVEWLQGVPNLDSMDEIMENDPKDIDHFFQNGNLSLRNNEVFIISGPRGTVDQELNRYRTRSISLAGARGADRLAVRGCYVNKRARPKQSTVYIMISADTWPGYRFCPEIYFPHLGAGAVPVLNPNAMIRLPDIAGRLLQLAEVSEKDVNKELRT
jgi:hypothetical protein